MVGVFSQGEKHVYKSPGKFIKRINILFMACEHKRVVKTPIYIYFFMRN